MTMYQGTLLMGIVTNLLVRKGFCPLPSQDLNSRENMLYQILPVGEYYEVMEKSYQVVGCTNPW